MSLLNSAAAPSWLSSRQQKLAFQNSMNLLSTSALGRVQYQQVREQYLEYLLDQNDAAEARRVLDSFNNPERQSETVQIAELRLAAAENKRKDCTAGYAQTRPLLLLTLHFCRKRRRSSRDVERLVRVSRYLSCCTHVRLRVPSIQQRISVLLRSALNKTGWIRPGIY